MTDPLPGAHAWNLLSKFTDPSATTRSTWMLEDGPDSVRWKRGLVAMRRWPPATRSAAAFWKIRHSVSEGNVAHGMSLNHDVAVPTSVLPEFVERATTHIEARFPQAEIITIHLGDGNVHFLTIFPRAFWEALADPADYASSVRHAVFDLAHQFDGTFSAEHGIGQGLTGEMERYKPAVGIDLMHRLKALLDPRGIMNPGKVLRPPISGRGR